LALLPAAVENLWTIRSKAVEKRTPEIYLTTKGARFGSVRRCARAFVPRFA
jgi:hypothetical protein